MEMEVVNSLRKRSLTLSLAESCTGGYVSHRITMIPGSSKVFYGGVITYSNQLKVRLLGVRKDDIEREGAVSSQVASEMAAGVRRVTSSDVGGGITGIAGPRGVSPQKPVGLVYLGFDFKGEVKVERRVFKGLERGQFKERVAQEFFGILLKIVEEHD